MPLRAEGSRVTVSLLAGPDWQLIGLPVLKVLNTTSTQRSVSACSAHGRAAVW